MERRVFKKHLHLKPDEKIEVARMIDNGASLDKVNKWYMNRFGQKMSKSSYYDLKNKRAKVLTEAVNGKKKNDYRRKGEDDLATFEDHLRLKIAELTESNNCILWTYPLLQDVALEEREKEPFVHMEVLQKYCFTNKYWEKFMDRNELDFSSRKSDQKKFTDEKIAKFRRDLDNRMMFYPTNNILNSDETAFFYLQTKGRIIHEKGNVSCTA